MKHSIHVFCKYMYIDEVIHRKAFSGFTVMATLLTLKNRTKAAFDSFLYFIPANLLYSAIWKYKVLYSRLHYNKHTL